MIVKEYEISYWGKVRVPCMQHLLWINWNYIMSNCREYVLYFPSGINDMPFYDRLLILLWKYPHMICAHSNAIAVDAESWNSCSTLHYTNGTPAVHSLLLPTKVRLSPNLLVICVHNANALVSPNGFRSKRRDICMPLDQISQNCTMALRCTLYMNLNSSSERVHINIKSFSDHLGYTCALATPKQTSQTGS